VRWVRGRVHARGGEGRGGKRCYVGMYVCMYCGFGWGIRGWRLGEEGMYVKVAGAGTGGDLLLTWAFDLRSRLVRTYIHTYIHMVCMLR
jgi:hypothetical protein